MPIEPGDIEVNFWFRSEGQLSKEVLDDLNNILNTGFKAWSKKHGIILKVINNEPIRRIPDSG